MFKVFKHLQVATDSGFTNIVKNGSYNSTVDNDYTVKVIASGLNPATSYVFNFIIPNGTIVSPTGKFRYCFSHLEHSGACPTFDHL